MGRVKKLQAIHLALCAVNMRGSPASLLTCVDMSAQLTQWGECFWACLEEP